MNNTKVGLIVIAILDVLIVSVLYYATLSSPSIRDIAQQVVTEEDIAITNENKRLVNTTMDSIRKATTTFVTSEKLLSPYILDDFEGNANFSIIEKYSPRLTKESSNATENTCPQNPPGLVGKMKVPDNIEAPTWDTIISENPLVKEGRYTPTDCGARFKVAIIIPLRDREEHLRILLYHLHPILKRQQLDYTIYTISLAGNGQFNRAKLMNAGFVEANKDREYDCYIFHDADLLLEDDNCLYWCSKEPREVAQFMNKFGYKPLSYGLGCKTPEAPKVNKYFGGVAMVSHKLFMEVNGFSNLYWGWGGEDDDMYSRLYGIGHDIVNPYGKQCSFSMIKHEREGSNSVNQARFVLLYHTINRMKVEGLNTLRYKRIALERNPMYTNVTVDIGAQSKNMIDFMKSPLNKVKCGETKLPWQI